MGLMTSMYTGVSGLRSSQTSLNVTANNLANVYTDGYVRQQVIQADTMYNTLRTTYVNTWQVGLGTEVTDTRHIRDFFLDKSYRQEAGRQSYYQTQYDTVTEIETILGETEGVQFQKSISDLYSALAEMEKTPNSTTTRSALVLSAEAFLTRANAVYDSLKSYQDTLNTKIIDTVDKVNKLGDEIYMLNTKILSIESTGIETAFELRDQRDNALDELSTLAKISYTEIDGGKVEVDIEGVEFVTEGTVFHMSTMLDRDSGDDFITAIWPQLDDQYVFNRKEEISTAKNSDIGELKSLLASRGTKVASMYDIPENEAPSLEALVEPNEADYATQAEYQAAMDVYNGQVDAQAQTMSEYDEKVEYYNNIILNSPIMTAQSLLDKLVNGIVTTINGVLCPEVDVTLTSNRTLIDENGNSVTFNEGDTLTLLSTEDMISVFGLPEDTEIAGYGQDDAKTRGAELFSRDMTQRYSVYTDNAENTYYVYNKNNEFGHEEGYTLGNLEINQQVEEDYGVFGFTTSSGDEDYDRANKLISEWEKDFDNLDPYDLTTKNFNEFYVGIIGKIANQGSLYKTMSESQMNVTNGLSDQRQSYTGVSSEEELSNMIRFQNAYNASSRYINVINEMLEHIVTNL